MKVQREGQNPQEGSLEIKDVYQTLSKAFDIARPTSKVSSKSLKEDDQHFLSGNHTGNQRESCELIDASLFFVKDTIKGFRKAGYQSYRAVV